MTTLTVRSNVGPDGTLRLEVPSGLPPGPVEVIVVVQPAAPSEEESNSDRLAVEHEPRIHRARSGLFLNRGSGGVVVDAVTEEMESAWKTKLADLEP
jgi:hypothetical protein